MGSGAERNEPCPCGSGRKYKHCCIDKAKCSSDGDETRHQRAGNTEMTLVINTRSTHGVRRIPGASALPDAAERGYAAETATRSAAVEWGLPDFVYESANERVGRGTRELGDGIVIVGELGVVLQVKSRDAVSVQMEKESRWLEKQTARALAQGAGTVRRLKLAPVPLTNLRGRTIEVDGNAHRWLLVVIVDHDQPPSGIEPSPSEKHPSIVLLRRDWEFLFDQLKSTHAVCQYCERVADEPLELGTEPLRYYELAQADAEAKPSNLAGPEIASPRHCFQWHRPAVRTSRPTYSSERSLRRLPRHGH